jgi:hypothetical protein
VTPESVLLPFRRSTLEANGVAVRVADDDISIVRVAIDDGDPALLKMTAERGKIIDGEDERRFYFGVRALALKKIHAKLCATHIQLDEFALPGLRSLQTEYVLIEAHATVEIARSHGGVTQVHFETKSRILPNRHRTLRSRVGDQPARPPYLVIAGIIASKKLLATLFPVSMQRQDKGGTHARVLASEAAVAT